MPESTEKQIAQIQQTIAALEAQRGILAEEVINASIAALKEKIAFLESKAASPEQQRKLATLLFMDTVGSTHLYAGLDPEVTRDIQDGILKRMSDVIQEQGGHVTRFMGDGFMAVFGVPLAKENDPEQAIRAGMKIQTAAQEIAKDLKQQYNIDGYQVRVGVNTGLVAVGGVTEAGDTVMGAAVNLAARLESAAPPGGLLISHNTYRHVAGLFEVSAQAPVTAKGFDEPIAVYLVKRLKPRTFSMPERGVEGVQTHLIGRDIEMHLLQDTLHHILQSGEGQVITIVGEAGVGKSRLMVEFLNWVDKLPENLEIYLGRSELEKQSQPYALIRSVFASHYDIQESDPSEVVWRKMEKGLSGFTTPSEAHVAGQLVGFDFSSSPLLAEIADTPQQLRDQGTQIILDYFSKTASQVPVLICLEDIHWADDSSLDLFDLIGQRLQNRRLLILNSARTSLFERRPFWGEGQAFHNRIKLPPLSKWDSRLLVEEILGQAEQLPNQVREMVVGGAEGNPFYIEEMIKMLVEQGVFQKGTSWQIEPNRLVQVQIPSTLTGVLQARLDGLPAAEREVLQQASVVGRFFWDQAVEHLDQDSRSERGSVPAVLSSLRSRELIFRREASTISGAQEYLFKHEVLREVTYESIPLKLRRLYHGQAAQWLMEHSGERVGEYAGQIAEHYKLANQKEEAVDCLIQAGDQAAKRFANSEAIFYFNRGLELVRELPHSTARDEQELELWTALGVPLVVQKGYGAAETNLAYQKAYELCQQLGKEPSPPILRGLVVAGLTRGDIEQSYQYGVQLLNQAEMQQDSILLTEAHYALGVNLFWQGKFEHSRKHLELALENYDPNKRNIHLSRFSQDPRVICLVRLGLSLWFLGFPDQAKQKNNESLAYARALEHPFSLIYALSFSTLLNALISDDEATHRDAQEAIRLGEEHQVFQGFSYPSLIDIWVTQTPETLETSIQLFIDKVASYTQSQQLEYIRPFFNLLLADMLDCTGRTQESWDILDETSQRAEHQRLFWYQAELTRLRGELSLNIEKKRPLAEACFHQAIEVAQNQAALSLELRAAMSLGNLWKSQGKVEAARQLVSEVLAKFNEGFDTPDLRQAAEFVR